MVSEAKKKSNYKWDKKNMCNLSCRVKRTDAEKYKAAAKAKGTNINAVLKKALDELLEDN